MDLTGRVESKVKNAWVMVAQMYDNFCRRPFSFYLRCS